MFTTMHAFLFFFIPTLCLILLGIIFEERLIAFEQRVISRVFRRTCTRAKQSNSRSAAPRLQRVAPQQNSARRSRNRAA